MTIVPSRACTVQVIAACGVVTVVEGASAGCQGIAAMGAPGLNQIPIAKARMWLPGSRDGTGMAARAPDLPCRVLGFHEGLNFS
jgi:hypothetical protein